MQLANLIFLCFGLCLALGACGGGKSPSAPASGTSAAAAPSSLKEQIDKLEDSGQLPKLDRSSNLPADLNSNGVRDDIEAYIASLPLSEVQKKAVMQDAKAMQMTLTVDLTDKVALQKVGDTLLASSSCLGDVISNFTDYSQKIESMTANTKERAKQYIKYNAAQSGSVFSMPSGDSCVK